MNIRTRTLTNWRAVTVASALCTAVPVGHAADISWNVGDGNWSTASNWYPTSVPSGTDHALLKSTDATNRTVSYTSNNPAFELMNIDATGAGTMTLDITGGTLQTTGPQDFVAVDGQGAITQTGGTYSNSSFILANMAASVGTYNLGGSGTLSVATFEYVANQGQGTFTQTGGTHSVGTNLSLGANASGKGTYNLSGTGDLNVTGRENVGLSGHGEFNQSGGTNAVGDTLYIARNAGSTGIYALSGGTLDAQNGIGNGINNINTLTSGGTATFNYTGGTLNITGKVFANSGQFNISGTGTRVVNGDVTNTSGGTIKVTNTTAEFIGTMTNAGAYISDPSDNIFTNLIVESSGYLQGQTGDRFLIGGDFTNNSTQTASWSTDDAILQFTGVAGSAHEYILGNVAALFEWGVLEVASANDLLILGSAPGTLYFDRIFLGDQSQLDSSFALSYGELYVAGQLVDRDGIIPASIPEPATLALFALGLAGLGAVRRKKLAA